MGGSSSKPTYTHLEVQSMSFADSSWCDGNGNNNAIKIWYACNAGVVTVYSSSKYVNGFEKESQCLPFQHCTSGTKKMIDISDKKCNKLRVKVWTYYDYGDDSMDSCTRKTDKEPDAQVFDGEEWKWFSATPDGVSRYEWGIEAVTKDRRRNLKEQQELEERKLELDAHVWDFMPADENCLFADYDVNLFLNGEETLLVADPGSDSGCIPITMRSIVLEDGEPQKSIDEIDNETHDHYEALFNRWGYAPGTPHAISFGNYPLDEILAAFRDANAGHGTDDGHFDMLHGNVGVLLSNVLKNLGAEPQEWELWAISQLIASDYPEVVTEIRENAPDEINAKEPGEVVQWFLRESLDFFEDNDEDVEGEDNDEDVEGDEDVVGEGGDADIEGDEDIEN